MTGRRVGPLTVLRIVAAATALRQIAKAARVAAPVTPVEAGANAATLPSISVVIPARDEVRRLGPLLDALCRPGAGAGAGAGADADVIVEVIVVDDQSTDGTAAFARSFGATVIAGRPLGDGWAGKAWALQQGIEAASGEWVVTLDADTRPDPRLASAVVARAIADGYDLVTVGGRFECPTAGVAWLHPAMLTTLVYRFGPPGWLGRTPLRRMLANGQCMALHRPTFLAGGGLHPVRGAVVEDVALARHLAATGRRVAMLDASSLLTTRMYDDLDDAWRGWGRSLALPGVEPTWRQVLDLVVLASTIALPLPRLLLRRGDALDVVLLAARFGTLAGTVRAYVLPDRRRRLAYWCSPLADLPATVAVAVGVVRRRHSWRGRQYPRR